jgi:hypothetical protein
MTVPDLTRPLSIVQQAQSPEGDQSRRLQTFGPTANESTTQYSRNEAAHNVVTLQRVSPDLTLGHGARVAAFYRRLDESPVLDPTTRNTRDQVLRAELRPRVAAPGEIVIVSPAAAPAGVPLAVPAQLGSPFGIGGFGIQGFGA